MQCGAAMQTHNHTTTVQGSHKSLCGLIRRKKVERSGQVIPPQVASATKHIPSTNTAHEAVAKLEPFVEIQARNLVHDSFTRDDIKQEMFLAILMAGDGHTLSYYRSIAACRARDFLRKQYQTRRVRSKVISVGDSNAVLKVEADEARRNENHKRTNRPGVYDVDWSAIDDRLDAETGLVEMEV